MEDGKRNSGRFRAKGSKEERERRKSSRSMMKNAKDSKKKLGRRLTT